MTPRHDQEPATHGGRIAVVIVASIIGAFCAVVFWVSLYVVNAGSENTNLLPLIGYGAAIIASLALPAIAVVTLLQRQWRWVLIAGITGFILALTAVGVS